MSGYWYKNGQTGAIVRIKLNNSTATSPTNAGITGLSNTSTGLIIATMCDVEATASAYTSAASTIGSIATLGTYVAPSSGQCNFKQIDIQAGTNFNSSIQDFPSRKLSSLGSVFRQCLV
jgi:hypothetical protein